MTEGFCCVEVSAVPEATSPKSHSCDVIDPTELLVN